MLFMGGGRVLILKKISLFFTQKGEEQQGQNYNPNLLDKHAKFCYLREFVPKSWFADCH